jgi:hypothetical protein
MRAVLFLVFLAWGDGGDGIFTYLDTKPGKDQFDKID